MKISTTRKKKSKIEQLADLILKVLSKDQAENIEIIDLEGKTDIASLMIIANGKNVKHIKAIADRLITALRIDGKHPLSEGLDKKDWILIDVLDIVIHLFTKETRVLYDLESLWKR